MVIHVLSYQGITIKVKSLGAELFSLVDEQSGQEYMWSGDPEYWNRTSPILFPFIGRLKKQQYNYKGKKYEPTPHGFARDMEFVVAEKTENSLWFAIKDNEDTKKVYPFSFLLEIGYVLEARKLQVKWRVKNTGTEKMYFSIGGHPGFVCPMNPEEQRRDSYLYFEGKEQIISREVSMKEGLVTDKYNVLSLEDGKLKIADDLFEADALVLENHQIKKLDLLTKEGKTYITFSMDAPVYGIWSCVKPGAPFVCIEPWYGRCDAVDFKGSLEEREWQQQLESEEIFETYYQIEI